MKKLINFLGIISLFIFVGIQGAYAQIDISIDLLPDCPHTCTTQENCVRYVEYTIYEICGEDQEVVCHDSAFVNCSTNPVNFDCNYDCEDATHNPCYYATASAKKLCVGPGGTIIKCNGSDSMYLTCIELLGGVYFDITWE